MEPIETVETVEQETVRKRVWVQNVAVQAAVLQQRLNAIRARTSDDDRYTCTVIEGIERLLDTARKAAYRENPIPTRWANWWQGTLIEAAYQNLHAAEAEIALLYDDAETEAEIAEAVARIEAGLNRHDPRRMDVRAWKDMPPGPAKRQFLRKTIEVGYAAADRQHSRVRSFRNIILVAASLIALFTAVFVGLVSQHPDWVPLCFRDAGSVTTFCPTGSATASAQAPGSADVVVVALLGLTGGSVAAAVSIRNMRGTSTPYGVPVALAFLKIPLGALTALVALIAIRGDFVPGLSALDSQEQILAYAVAFGYAQQILTTRIDQRARDLLDKIPSKDADVERGALSWTHVLGDVQTPLTAEPPPAIT